jgi:hypothetical protein
VELRNLPLLMLGNSGARVEAHSGGLFGLDNSGAGAFALVTNPVSWQGQALGAGDVMIGSATAGQYIHWDASETRLTVAGDILIQDPIGWNDVLNKPAGAARLGTGTPSSTGLWLTGTRLGYWNASVNDWQAVIQSDGVTRFGRNVSGSTAMTWDPSTGRLRFFGGGASLPRMELRADGALHIGIHSSDPERGRVRVSESGRHLVSGRPQCVLGRGYGVGNYLGIY